MAACCGLCTTRRLRDSDRHPSHVASCAGNRAEPDAAPAAAGAATTDSEVRRNRAKSSAAASLALPLEKVNGILMVRQSLDLDAQSHKLHHESVNFMLDLRVLQQRIVSDGPLFHNRGGACAATRIPLSWSRVLLLTRTRSAAMIRTHAIQVAATGVRPSRTRGPDPQCNPGSCSPLFFPPGIISEFGSPAAK
jgi:hypothetical protein